MRCFLLFAVLAISLRAKVIAVDVDGPINPVTAEIVESAVGEANASHASAVVLQLNTPGGLLDSTRLIVRSLMTSRIPVIVWVGPSGVRAASAGFFILESAGYAAMAPGTNTGASHPVTSLGQPIEGVMNQKVENDAAAFLRSIVTQRGRNAPIAEKAVRESVSWTEREALKSELIDAVAGDIDTLLSGTDSKLHIPDKSVEWYKPSLRLKVLSAISDPNIALLLFVIGALCVYVEFTVPGMIAPGVAGAVLLLLSVTAFSMFPINWLGAALIALALIFFILEASLYRTAVLTAGGAIAMVLGAIMLIDSRSDTRIHLSTAVALAIPFALITSFLFSLAARARRNKVVTGAEGMLNRMGTVTADLKPLGTVVVHGEHWSALSAIPLSRDSRIASPEWKACYCG